MMPRHSYLQIIFLLLASQSTVDAFASPQAPFKPVFASSVQEKDQLTAESDVTTPERETIPLPPVIQGIADERKEYQMNVGKAMDVLRSDMRDILTEKPDFSIYDKNIEVIDPSGVRLNGLKQYKSAFAFFQTFIRFWFSEKSGLQFRMVYDFARCSIRISWNVVLVPKVPLGRPLHVDGISYYQLDRKSGKVVEHKIENLLINNSPVAPPYGLFSLVQQDMLRIRSPQGVPAGIGAASGGCFQ
uniref:SnoaL-like domain-containing protein n=1 Tax=Entomoneis paludosa TaxID=265537 RepID=A0A7S2VCF0_9STRA|eukprot:CAMPEP_0172442758 /NCGR_PEP_ID=MMETSP1065-20121228/3148_1 /TAXON_ID=265537 /ORGANISM="Amphiprora paludosa, Strain CCMP125" /LENGTH=243 /DNA_ID=CAMNT_0013192761 /DNA_START=19 /DNA_END=750 /DNA_ORIENTATION=-